MIQSGPARRHALVHPLCSPANLNRPARKAAKRGAPVTFGVSLLLDGFLTGIIRPLENAQNPQEESQSDHDRPVGGDGSRQPGQSILMAIRRQTWRQQRGHLRIAEKIQSNFEMGKPIRFVFEFLQLGRII